MRLAKEAKSQCQGEAGQGRPGGGAPGLHAAKRRKIGEDPPRPLVPSLTGRGMCPPKDELSGRRPPRQAGRPQHQWARGGGSRSSLENRSEAKSVGTRPVVRR